MCFVLPGLVTILVLSTVYALYGQVLLVAAVFFGLKAAVLAVVVEAVLRIGHRALKTPAMVVIAMAAFLAIFVFAVPFPWIVLVAGIAGLIGSRFLPGQFPAPADGKDDTTSSYLADRLLATGQLSHTQASSKRAIGIALADWHCGGCRSLPSWACLAWTASSRSRACSLARRRSSPSAAPTLCWHTWHSASSRVNTCLLYTSRCV